MLLDKSMARNEEQEHKQCWRQESEAIEKSSEPEWPRSAKSAVFRRGSSGELFLVHNGKQKSVHLKPCFPWTDPRRYISVRDQADKEVLYIDSLSEVDVVSKKALKIALEEASYVMTIKKILEVQEDFELRVWKVKVSDGSERIFQTKLDEWPFSVPGGGLLIRDVGGDLYFVAKPKQLDEESRKQFWAFLD